jgi:hypothetical protein
MVCNRQLSYFSDRLGTENNLFTVDRISFVVLKVVFRKYCHMFRVFYRIAVYYKRSVLCLVYARNERDRHK